MNGQEKDDEVFKGAMSAEYWEYDSRLGRRWNLDPVNKPWQNRYHAFSNKPIMNTDPNGANDDDHYINKDGSIKTVKTDDTFDRFYVETGTYDNKKYSLAAQLDKNENGLVKFPDSGLGFTRYSGVDAGGQSQNPKENVGKGDHYVQPEVAAALFGIINEVRMQGIKLSLGDMSSSSGSDPWQPGSDHHKGHGHNGKRSGIDVDFRYVDSEG